RVSATLGVQRWPACARDAGNYSLVILLSDGIGGHTVPRAGVLSINHVAVKTDGDLATLRQGSLWVCHCRIATRHVAEATAITAQVLDDYPMRVAHCSSLVDPLLEGA